MFRRYILRAEEYYKQGYSCSESLLKEGIDNGYCRAEVLPVATSFCGGMGSGCLCGAVAGSQIVIGSIYGRSNAKENSQIAKDKAREFVSLFKEKYKFTCCKTLCKGLEGEAKRAHCSEMIHFCSRTLDKVLDLKAEVNG